MKIGILGGTFDPIHSGHLVLAQEAWYALKLDKVVFVPAFIQPLKEQEGDAGAADRLNMVRLALEGEDRFGISTYEIDKRDVSYSIDTVRHFKEKYGEDADLYFLAGADSAGELSKWKDIDELLRLVTFVVATRPGWEASGAYRDKITTIDIPAIDVSSTIIRQRIRQHKPIDDLVPGQVARYIRNKGLYRE